MNNYENLINTLLDNRYKLTGIIGIGGMAVVYKAEDMAMHRKVAIKMLKDDIKEDIQEVKRFINESKAVARLSHPNIVHIYDVSVEDKENSQYIVMELIDGITLKDYIVRKGRLTWREAISYAKQILNALNHAHSRGIIHRDIKPQNAMLLRNGTLKITDFGIAKMQDSEPLTMTDKAIGTVHYISPEQASGEGTVTNISDIYSVGVLLYEMTTGQLPFNGNTAIQVAMMQIKETPKDPRSINPEIPKGLAQIILKAMNKAPQNRYQSAGDMIKQLSILSANPAVVFNNNGNNPGSSSNLPVVIEANNGAQRNQNSKSIEAINKTRRNMPAEIFTGNKNKIEKADKFNEEEMRKKGRTSKKNILRRKNSRSMLPIISGVTLAFLIVLLWSLIQLMSNVPILGMQEEDEEANTVTIPDYKGRVLDDELKAEMAELRLSVGNITYKSNDNYDKDEIILHKPEPGDVKKFVNDKATIPISFDISTGKDTYVVEDLTIMESRSVDLMLEQKRLIVEIEYEPDDTVMGGYIIKTMRYVDNDKDRNEKIDLLPGEVLNAGDIIILQVSEGKTIKRVIMPDVIGMSETEARRELARSEIVVAKVVEEYSDEYAPGYITDQSIKPFTMNLPAKSTRVTLTRSLGPGPTEPPPEPPAPTDETKPTAIENRFF
ncbi:MAG: protein kinase [Oscillospiraceae bacterium]|nr:protein kinase [Oscillospiraceae bacterium]